MADKNAALNAALAQIEKQYGKGTVMRLGQNTEMNVEAISTGSLSVDLATGIGGLPKGRIVEIFKPHSITKGVKVNAIGDRIGIDVYIVAKYGVSIRAVAEALKESIKYKVERFTGMVVDTINVKVTGVRA